jgi:hypothetical protein
VLRFLQRLRPLRPRQNPPDQDPEIQQEIDDGLALVQRTEAAGSLPVLETQHRAIGSDVCHIALPVSRPDHAEAFGKLFVTSRRVIFSGPSPVALGVGHVIRAERIDRDVLIVSGSAGLLRFRCNSFGDAMLAVWILDRLRKGAS